MWFAIILLFPFWWGMGLLLLALLGDLVPGWRGTVLRLFDRLEGRNPESTRRIKDVPDRQAA
jgi:hypothetical protein